MRKIVYKDKYHIKNRGDVYSINLIENGIEETHRQKVNEMLLGTQVEIDGKLYIVKGVESFAVYDIHDVGLLVEEITDKLINNGE